ncbi:MAG: L,D-transpeptidase family protein [Rhodovulum sp.]
MRINGKTDTASIGSRAANGCVRMFNSHVIQLYDQVPISAPAVLHPG